MPYKLIIILTDLILFIIDKEALLDYKTKVLKI
ncbi:hypothetical protein MY4824_003938 [Beauveria thailandica]